MIMSNVPGYLATIHRNTTSQILHILYKISFQIISLSQRNTLAQDV